MRIIRIMTLCLLALSLWLSGCAHVFQPPSAETRAGFGTIAVVSPATQIQAGSGAPSSVLSSSWGGAYMGVHEKGLTDIALGVTLGMMVSMVEGGVELYNPWHTHAPRDAVIDAENSINHALRSIEIQQAMQDRVFNAARERTSCNIIPVFVPVKENLASPGEGVSCRDLKNFGMDTALVVDVTEYVLGEGWLPLENNPPLPFILKVRVRLLRCPDGKELYTNTFSYKSESRKFFEWAYGGAKPLADEINRACELLSRQVVDEALLGVPTVPYTPPRTRYVPGFEPSTRQRNLFEPSDIHKLDEGPGLW